MSRSPLAYPLTRSVDGDAGGSADLQTDVMRFMAILALCLMAIFALVQSLPLVPAPLPSAEAAAFPEPDITTPPPEPPVRTPERVDVPDPKIATRTPANVALTRPKWVPKFTPQKSPTEKSVPRTENVVEQEPLSAEPEPQPVEPEPPATRQQGFTLRFESDHALTRLVAAHQVGLYAIAADRAQRMTVSESRISFWDASLPNSFHEMEAATVPGPVIDALLRAGGDTSGVNWGVTLPGKLRQQLDTLMQEHAGGSLVIGTDGKLRLEAS